MANESHASTQDSNAQLAAKVAELEAALKAAQAAKVSRVTLKVSEKKALSVYGLGRWPVTLYRSQWDRLIGMAPEISKFIIDHKDELAEKAE